MRSVGGNSRLAFTLYRSFSFWEQSPFTLYRVFSCGEQSPFTLYRVFSCGEQSPFTLYRVFSCRETVADGAVLQVEQCSRTQGRMRAGI